jgi:hypothetical protein
LQVDSSEEQSEEDDAENTRIQLVEIEEERDNWNTLFQELVKQPDSIEKFKRYLLFFA